MLGRQARRLNAESQVVPTYMSVKHTVTCQDVSQLTVTTSFHAHMASLPRTTLRRTGL